MRKLLSPPSRLREKTFLFVVNLERFYWLERFYLHLLSTHARESHRSSTRSFDSQLQWKMATFGRRKEFSKITVRCAEWWMSAKCSRAYVPTAVSRASLFYGATSFVFVSLLVVILTLRSDVCCVLRRRQEMTVFCKGWKKWLKVSRWIMLKQHLKQVWRISRNLEDNL